jgi:hypothetical protein
MAWKGCRAQHRSGSALPALWLLVVLSTLMRAATHLGGKRIAVRATTPGAAWTRAARARVCECASVCSGDPPAALGWEMAA